MRTVISVRLKDAMNASCTAGGYFFRKIFKLYGRNGSIRLSQTKLKKLAKEFIVFKQKSRSYDITSIATDVHYRCFFDAFLDTVERKSRVRIRVSQDWIQRQYGTEKQILSAFWKELNRVAL